MDQHWVNVCWVICNKTEPGPSHFITIQNKSDFISQSIVQLFLTDELHVYTPLSYRNKHTEIAGMPHQKQITVDLIMFINPHLSADWPDTMEILESVLLASGAKWCPSGVLQTTCAEQKVTKFELFTVFSSFLLDPHLSNMLNGDWKSTLVLSKVEKQSSCLLEQ